MFSTYAVVIFVVGLLTVHCGDVTSQNSANSTPMGPHQGSVTPQPPSKKLESTQTTPHLVTQTTPPAERLLNKKTGTKKQLCSGLPCIRKCCGRYQMVKMLSTAGDSGSCVNYKKLNYTQLPMPNPIIYNRRRLPTKKRFEGDFQIIIGVKIVYEMNGFMMEDFYVIEDGTLMLDQPNNWNRWVVVDNDHFCIDFVLLSTGGVVLRPFVAVHQQEEEGRDLIAATVAMTISSVFLVATLVVYGYVPRLRNLHGKVLMAYASSLLGFFLTQSLLYIVHEIDPVNGSNMAFCHILGLPSYFSILASFFWMNVMSYDIWYKFRGMIESRVINRRGENHKFLMYCLYGFGCPLGMTVIFAILNYLPMDQINRDVVTPGIANKSCFVGGVEVLLYLYAPMTVLIAANCVLFILTALNIIGLKKDAKTLKKSGTKASKKQFLVYAKIFSLMGLSWLLDVISTTTPKMFLWYFVDVYNCMLGVFVFFIFVGKRRILGMVTNRYRERAGTLPSRTSRNRNASSASSAITDQSDGEHDPSVTYPVNFDPQARESKAALL